MHCAVIGGQSYVLSLLMDDYDASPDAQTNVISIMHVSRKNYTSINRLIIQWNLY